MNIKKFIEIIHLAENLKNNTRHSWTSSGRHESVAEHTFRLTMMAYFMKDEFPKADIDKVIKMCIFHDIGEAFTGDIPAFEKNEKHEVIEDNKVKEWLSTLPNPYKDELIHLFKEMKEMKSEEARIYKALDKMEAIIQHNEAHISTWLPLEYDLQFTYGEKEVQFSGYMKLLKKEINKESENKIRLQK